jgi:hypothetical protein
MGLFRRKPENGAIDHYGLTEWWLSTFSAEERDYINGRYRPMGTSGAQLVGEWSPGDARSRAQAGTFLVGLASWFRSREVRDIALRILAKAEEVSGVSGSVTDRHFAYQGLIQTHYRDRDARPGALDDAIAACQNQITIAPKVAAAMRREYRGEPLPRHVGFDQLVVIRAKQGDYPEAVRLCREADRQGWRGDWDKRMEKYEKRLHK